MKKINLSILFLSLCMAVMAQHKEVRNLSSFSKLEVSRAVKVYIEKGSTEKARIEVSGLDLEDIKTEVNGSTLNIGIHKHKKHLRNVDVTVYLTYKSLSAIEANSAASVYTKELFKSDKLKLDVNSAATIALEISVGSLYVDVSSAGDIQLEGEADSQEISVSSAGSYKAYDLDCKESDIHVSSAGSAKIVALNKLKAKASSAGSIKYKGNPKNTNVHASSGGSIKKMN